MEPEPKKQKTTAAAAAATTTTTLLDIPDDCWKQILSYIDNLDNPHFHIHQNNRKSLSSTCKHLLYATNRLPYSFPVTDQLISHPDLLRRIIRRFSSSLHSLDLTPFVGDVDAGLSLLTTTAAATTTCLRSVRRVILPSSGHVPINGLRRLAEVCDGGLTVLELYNCSTLSDDHLIEICNLFCQIEEIVVSIDGICLISDVGIVYLAKKLKSLKRINVSKNPKITDLSLVALSDHCLSLSDVDVCDCDSVTQHGVGYMLRHSSKLDRLVISYGITDSALSSFSIKDSVGFSRSLSTLELFDMDVKDSLLVSLARAKLPLMNLRIVACEKFTIQGLASFLSAYPNLEELELHLAMCLTDKVVEGLVCYFKRLTVIKLGNCELTEATFCLLVKCCPVLEEIGMEGTNLGGGEFSEVVVQNRSIKYLNLSQNSGLTDEKLQAIGLMCPNLMHLDVDSCYQLTRKGFVGVLESCCEIKHISAFEFSDSKFFDGDLECSRFKLELLELVSSNINDDGLLGIAKACPNLLLLDSTHCHGITSTGMKEVVRCCTRLENISLGRACLSNLCPNVIADIVMGLVLAGPSLKKILALAPFEYRPNSSDEEVLFNHGCSVEIVPCLPV